MATDTTRLLRGLEDYHASLVKHLTSLQAEYNQLDRRWRAFSAVYEGTAAREFHAHWERTRRMFEEYMQATQKIQHILDERIEALRRLDSAGGLR